MRAVADAFGPLRGLQGSSGVGLRVTALPHRKGSAAQNLWGVQNAPPLNIGMCSIEVLESAEYRYEWQGLEAACERVRADPEEIFQPDSDSGFTGRLRPGLATGTVSVVLWMGDVIIGELEIEVRSCKLFYQNEYRWMLRDIAEGMTELVMDRFAASGARFEQDETRDAVTLYQRFTFLRALLESESFQLAIQEVFRRPHTAWETNIHAVKPGSGLRCDSHLVRQMTRAGTRSRWIDGPLASIPDLIERRRTEATYDTTPNRFVRFALEHWRQVVGDIDRGLSIGSQTPAKARGRLEISAVLAQLDELLHHELFVDLRPITRFPADDQVLQRREGYRDIYKAYVDFELAARLSWHPKDSHAAGQRDVATLYEYWAFVSLAKVVASLVGKTFDLKPLLKVRPDGLTVGLRSGIETVLAGEVERHGRCMHVELCFNRTFGVSKADDGSWTRPMRPDYSLLIRPATYEPAGFEPVAIHFDAKYRVDFIDELFGSFENDSVVEVEDPPANERQRGGVLRSDLLKMHAYRDAIRRTAGAYVVYPGGDAEVGRQPFTEYHELLPGLGAFVLRPTEAGTPKGVLALQGFLDEVLDHVATRLTQHERGRYWQGAVYGTAASVDASVALDMPPYNTRVLLGYVKSREHWSWVLRTKTYNVRTEDRIGGVSSDAALLQSQLLVLYCPSTNEIALARVISDAEFVSLDGMRATRYPMPRGSYWCVQLSWIERPAWVSGLSTSLVDRFIARLGLPRGAPVGVTWGDLRSDCADAPSRLT